jgi:hypothetical protein
VRGTSLKKGSSDLIGSMTGYEINPKSIEKGRSLDTEIEREREGA